ncbi:LexA repressor [Bienertia sinuspersici]
MEREAVDMKIKRCLCVNAIPFNVLRSPMWQEMVYATNNAPKSYKGPLSEKAGKSLLDECKRGIKKDMISMRDTWYTHGMSIVSDGWSNCKHNQLINVTAANSRGAMFLDAGIFKAFFTNHGFILALFKTKYAKILKRVAKTGFGSHYIVLEKLLICKEALETTVVLKAWKDWISKQDAVVKTMDTLVVQNDNDENFGDKNDERFASTSCFYDHLYLQTLARGGYQRRAPNLDREVVMSRMEAFESAEDANEKNKLRDQFADLHLKKGTYSIPQAQMDAVTMEAEAIDWWSIHGSQTPSSPSAERAWSTNELIHTLKRNRLAYSKTNKIVYREFKKGTCRKWEAVPEDFSLEKSLMELEDMMWAGLNSDCEEEHGVKVNNSKRGRN